MLNRAISAKFLTRQVSLQSSHPNFPTFLSRQKWWPFSIFEKLQNTKCLYLENRARYSDFNEIFEPQGIPAD